MLQTTKPLVPLNNLAIIALEKAKKGTERNDRSFSLLALDSVGENIRHFGLCDL